jgi:hypothetical protein
VRVELHPEADAEFAAQVEYYERRQAGLGQRFYREVIGCLDWIAERSTLPRLRMDYRRVNLKVFPFYVGVFDAVKGPRQLSNSIQSMMAATATPRGIS